MVNFFHVLYILGKVLFGGYFIMNAYDHFKNLEGMAGYAKSKGVMWPKLAVGGTGVMMFVAGIGIISEQFIKGGQIYAFYSYALIAVFLAVVTFQMHQYWKATDPMQKMGEKINFFKNLALLGATLVLMVDTILLSLQ